MASPPQPWRPASSPIPCEQRHHQHQRQQRRYSKRSQLLVAGVCLLACLSIVPSQAAGAKTSSVRRQYNSDPDERLVGKFLHITDIHPDEHYINGGTISSSCHSTTEQDDDDDDDDDGDDDHDGNEEYNSKSLVSNWRKWLGSTRLFGNTSNRKQDKNDFKQARGKKVSAMRPGRTSGGHGGKYGAPYSICDSPFSLVNATFDWIDKNLRDEIDFIVWTGDNARHDSDNEHPRTQQEIEELNLMIARKFLDTFAADPDDPLQRRLPIVPSIGNNDVYPHNIMMAGPNRILQHFSDIWADFIPEDQYHTFQFGGYYITEVIPDKLAVVALNTLYFFNQNTAVNGCDDEEEPGSMQLDWLEVELRSLRSRKMSVYLTGHVPPARKSYSPTCYRRYSEIALKYQDVIVGHFFGHANIDHFIVMSDDAISKFPGLKTVEDTNEENNNNKEITMAVDEDDDGFAATEFNRYSATGLSSYLIELWEQYESIPKHAKLNNYAIANVGPSVIPTYNPSLRVYEYQLNSQPPSEDDQEEEEDDDDDDDDDGDGDNDDEPFSAVSEQSGPRLGTHLSASQRRFAVTKDITFGDAWEDGESSEEMDALKKKKKPRRKPRKPRKPRRPTYPPTPDPLTKLGHPLQYTQYWMNLTHVNEMQQEQQRRMRLGLGMKGDEPPFATPEYAIEYNTRQDYGLETLGVQEYLKLARRIVSDNKMKNQYLAWMVVLTGTENDQ
ncbi:Endopolyphosphatase [Actinomortierella wolfii]|nr:Endopolyphosphatase [Actinomortierella wolfii]